MKHKDWVPESPATCSLGSRPSANPLSLGRSFRTCPSPDGEASLALHSPTVDLAAFLRAVWPQGPHPSILLETPEFQ